MGREVVLTVWRLGGRTLVVINCGKCSGDLSYVSGGNIIPAANRNHTRGKYGRKRHERFHIHRRDVLDICFRY